MTAVSKPKSRPPRAATIALRRTSPFMLVLLASGTGPAPERERGAGHMSTRRRAPLLVSGRTAAAKRTKGSAGEQGQQLCPVRPGDRRWGPGRRAHLPVERGG